MTSEAANIVGLYRRHAKAWVEQRGQRLVERKWIEKFTALLPPNASVLDLGCGFGNPIGRYLQGNRMSFTARGFEAGSGCSSLPFSAFLRGSSRFLLC